MSCKNGNLVEDDPLGLGRNVRTRRVTSTASKKTTNDDDMLLSFVCNCLSCGKVYDCRRSATTTVLNRHTGDIATFLSSGGICQVCGTLVERAARELGVVDGDDEARIGGGEDDGQLLTREEEEAYVLRDTLVAFDREAAARTTVIDDQNEYYDIEANAWLSDDEREEMMAKIESDMSVSQLGQGMTVTFDMLGRRCIVVEDGDAEATYDIDEGVSSVVEAAVKERPYGGGRATAALVESASFVESLTERFGDSSRGFLTYRS